MDLETFLLSTVNTSDVRILDPWGVFLDSITTRFHIVKNEGDSSCTFLFWEVLRSQALESILTWMGKIRHKICGEKGDYLHLDILLEKNHFHSPGSVTLSCMHTLRNCLNHIRKWKLWWYFLLQKPLDGIQKIVFFKQRKTNLADVLTLCKYSVNDAC